MFTFQNNSDLSLDFTVLSPLTSKISNTLVEFCGAEQTLINIKCFYLTLSTTLHMNETKCHQGGSFKVNKNHLCYSTSI